MLYFMKFNILKRFYIYPHSGHIWCVSFLCVNSHFYLIHFPSDWLRSFLCSFLYWGSDGDQFCKFLYFWESFILPSSLTYILWVQFKVDRFLFVVSILKALLHSLAGCVSSIETFTLITLVLLCTERPFSRLLLWLSLRHWF